VFIFIFANQVLRSTSSPLAASAVIMQLVAAIGGLHPLNPTAVWPGKSN